MANTHCLTRGPASEEKNKRLQCLFFDSRRVVSDERLLCYPPEGRWILVPFGEPVSQTNMLSFARINVVSVRIIGRGNTPAPMPPICALESMVLKRTPTVNNDLAI